MRENVKTLFWILFLLNLLNYIDRQVLYSVFPLLQKDLALSDVQLGSLASAFMLVYMCFAPLAGYLADRSPRQKLIAAGAWIWSLATLLCAAARNYAGLLGARSLIGAGEAGFTTIAQPFLAEQYPPQKRATILALFGLALPAGSALGYVFGGLIGQHWGWKAAFMLAGAPGLVLGILAWTKLKDAARQNLSAAQTPRLKDYAAMLSNKPFLWLCLANAMITFVQGGLSAWMPTYFHRYFNFSVGRAGIIFGVIVVLCGAAGTFWGGKMADKLLAKTPKAYFITIFSGLLLTLPLAWAAVGLADARGAVLCTGLAVLCIFLPMAPIAAALVALTKDSVRATAFAVNLFIIHALGDALSPVLIGRAADAWGLQTAIGLCCTALLPGLLFTFLAAKNQLLQRKREGC